MSQNPTLAHVRDWAKEADEPNDSIRNLEWIPARLGMIDADLGSLSASLVDYERIVAGKGYALVGNPKNIKANGRRMDSQIRALLRRFWAAFDGTCAASPVVRARWNALMALIEAEEGLPCTGSRWNIGRHRTFCALRARSTLAPEHLSQEEIDRIGREMSADKRKGLRKAVLFLNSLIRLTNELPELLPFLPGTQLAPPAGSSAARRIDWTALPESFRASFEAAADACLADEGDLIGPRHTNLA